MIEPLHVCGHGYIAPHASLADFPLGPTVELPKPDLSLLERTLRRGLSDVTRLFMHVARLALDDAQVRASDIPVVFGSAFGEITTAEALLQQAYDEDASSPARFRHSVHNAAPGLLSISARNLQPATALAAGWDTVAMALVEVSAQLACGADQVLLVLADERVPVSLSAEHQHGSLAAAFVLRRSPCGRGVLKNLRRVSAEVAASLPDPFAGANHPLGPCIFIARALTARKTGSVRLGDGVEPWCVDVDASP